MGGLTGDVFQYSRSIPKTLHLQKWIKVMHHPWS